ncbi:MAG: formylglycine-generating enzyme family protein [Verrucomicrobiota bacterium]
MSRHFLVAALVLIAPAMTALVTGCSKVNSTEINPPPYYVIDLSGGPKAESYPVTALDEAPADLDSKTYKTDKLLLKWIEPGTFMMGQILEATPIHEVTLSQGFYFGVFELTQAQWKKVMGNNPSHFKNKPTNPVEMISWEDLRGLQKDHDWPSNPDTSPDSLMGKLTAKTGGDFTFDLPTEAQWEYACRAGTDTRWSWGNDRDVSGDHTWSNDNADDTTHPVGELKPNPWGLYDMHGNVWEWCLDRFGNYPHQPQIDPTGAATGWYRVWRGGGWETFYDLGRSAHRNGGVPESRGFHLGARIVMTDN